MLESYAKKILQARVYEVARKTPLDTMPRLSARLANRVLLKREDMQAVFSFKLRGAYNMIQALGPKERSRGIVAASAGNHAQGVALAASRMGIQATIVMPVTTPPIKVDAVRALGGRIELYGDNFDAAQSHALDLCAAHGQQFIPPFDHPDIIAGQGTVGLELLQQSPGAMDAVFVPVGGGGLIAGVAAMIKYLHPQIKVIGVEPDDAPTLHQALKHDRRVRLDEVGIFADGVAVRQIGKETFRVARRTVDEVILVSGDEICGAIKDIFEDTRVIMEPAGALALAGLHKYVRRSGARDQTLVAIGSGANMNFDRLAYVAERASFGHHTEALFAVTIPEQPGSFRDFCKAIGKRPITEFNYRYADDREAHVFVGLALGNGSQEPHQLLALLATHGYAVTDLTDNEMAKLHIRHMVGGRAEHVQNERLYRFEFPERPGALLDFLTRMAADWNISLFHYRNQGGDFGRVLIGLQVPQGDQNRFQEFLNQMGYRYRDETENIAHRLFL
ncbi:MAG: threonine ammonia-lyase, biosynthetic [Leptospiraceae bacterium]|nr:threonine ammonia-lyase, biosynthetic [Leptospiraceae bacterium]